MVKVGQLRHRVEIRRAGRTQRADGGYDNTPTTVATRWASLKPVKATEAEFAGRPRGAVTYLVTMHHEPALAITTDDQLRWTTGGGVVLNIREVRTPETETLMVEIVAETAAVK
jgi:head-tail adaptor